MFVLLLKLLKCKYRFKLPKPCEILIFDGNYNLTLNNYLKKHKFDVFFIRGEELNLSVFFYSLFCKGSFFEKYLEAFIKFTSPKIILTFTDNNHRFYTLSKKYPNIKTLFIQNGWREKYLDVFDELRKKNETESLFVDYKMVFGNYIGHKYSTYIGGKTINLGSFKNNEYPINNHKIKNTITYTSFFNSNWPKKEYFNTKVKLNDELITLKELFVLPDKMVLDFLVKYGKENNKKIFIIPRSKSNSDSLRKKEENYYKNILDLDINFMDYNHNYSSYNALDSSSVNVTIDSTLGYESLTRGNKVAFFSIRGSLNNCQDYGKFGWPGKYNDTGYFWTNIPNEKNFKTILDRLFLTSEKNWKKQLIINNVDSLIIRKENFIISQFINNELV